MQVPFRGFRAQAEAIYDIEYYVYTQSDAKGKRLC
jgi:hypothetical protein